MKAAFLRKSRPRWVIAGGFVFVALLWWWKPWLNQGLPHCGNSHRYQYVFSTGLKGLQDQAALGTDGFSLRTSLTVTLAHVAKSSFLQEWAFSSEVEEPESPALREALDGNYQGKLWVERDREGKFLRLYRPHDQPIAVTNHLKGLLFPLQVTLRPEKTFTTEEPSGLGMAKFDYEREGEHLRKRQAGYAELFPGVPAPEEANQETGFITKGLDLISAAGSEKLRVRLLSAPQPVESESRWDLQSAGSEDKELGTCALADSAAVVAAQNLILAAFNLEIDPEREKIALQNRAKSLSLTKLENELNARLQGGKTDRAQNLAEIQSRLTDLLSVDPKAVEQVFQKIKSTRDPERRRFYIGALGGATGEAAQLALGQLLDTYSRAPGEQEWFGFTARAVQFSPEPIAPNLDRLWQISQTAALNRDIRTSALFAVATASQRAPTPTLRAEYVGRILDLARAPEGKTDPVVAREAAGNLAHPDALPFFQELAQSATTPKQTAAALDGMRLIPGVDTERTLLPYTSTGRDPLVREAAYRSLRGRNLSENTVNQLVQAYETESDQSDLKQFILLVLAEPANRSYLRNSELLKRRREQGLLPFEKNILGESVP